MKTEGRQLSLSLMSGQQLRLSVRQAAFPHGEEGAHGSALLAGKLLIVDGVWGKESQFYLRVQLLICDQAPVDSPSFMSISARAKIRKGRKW